MTTSRVVLVHGLIGLVLGGHLVTLIFDPAAEAWPFSQYPMYSTRPAAFPDLGQRRLYGIERDHPSREVALVASRYIAPFDVEYINSGFARIMRSGDDARLHDALEDCARRYEALRLAGLHDGPPIRGVRLYGEMWHVHASLDNTAAPAVRSLLAEYREP